MDGCEPSTTFIFGRRARVLPKSVPASWPTNFLVILAPFGYIAGNTPSPPVFGSEAKNSFVYGNSASNFGPLLNKFCCLPEDTPSDVGGGLARALQDPRGLQAMAW